MNITQEKINNSTLGLKFEITSSDYYPLLQKELKELQKKANMPGFRPGKVPFSLIQKMYGNSAKAQVINEMAGKELDNYIKENNIKHLFYPLLDNSKNNADDWVNKEDFEMYFEVGLRPEINIDLSSLDIEKYKIIPDQKDINEYIDKLLNDFGHMHYHDIADEMDTIEAELIKDNDENPLKINFDIKDITDNETKKRLIGCKQDDIISVNFAEALGSEEKAAQLLKLTGDDVASANKNYDIKVLKIGHFHKAELNEDFYKSIYPNEDIKTEEEFVEKIKNYYENQLENESDYLFSKKVLDKLFNEVEIELPVDFIKRFLLEKEGSTLTKENIDNEIDKYIDFLKREIITTHILENNGIVIGYEDIREFYINNFLKRYLPPNLYGSEDNHDEKLLKLADNMLKNDHDYQRMADMLIDQKLIEVFKNNIPFKIKEISIDDLNNEN